MAIWLVLAVMLWTLAALGVVYRRNVAQARAIRAQTTRASLLEAHLSDLFERSRDVILLHDTRGRLTRINRAGELATGYSLDELRSLELCELFSVAYVDAIERMLHEGADALPRTIRAELLTRSGLHVPIEADARVVVRDGEVTGVNVLARDLSEIEHWQAQLRQAQKMEAVGRLASGIAHDFNNLITVLAGYCDELLEQIDHRSELRYPAEEIRHAIDRAAGLTQQLLAFSRRQESGIQSMDVNAVVAGMKPLLQRLIGADVRLDVALEPDVQPILADPVQVSQVVMNLAVNARDAMPSGGVLSIRTANSTRPESQATGARADVVIEVSDTGVGISPDVQERMFEPFFTTKREGVGTGLGLSVVQAIVRGFGGDISVTSEVGKGATFRVWLPQSQQRERVTAGPPRAPQEMAMAPATGSGVVLFVEDDRAVRRLMGAELQRRGFTVLEAQDGVDALSVCRRYEGTIDLLVTDVVMPVMNGIDLAKAAAELRPEMAVLMISGHPERARVGLDITGNLLLKPFTAYALATRINEALGRRRLDVPS